jgi:tetratricopeptide (TPR) repeat protein
MLAEYEQARARYEEARPIYAQIGARYGYAATLAYLGLTYRGLEETDKARQHLSEAVALFEEIKSPHADLVRQWLGEL